MPWTAVGEPAPVQAAGLPERHVRVRVRRSERGKVVVTFVEPAEAPELRRYVLISKAEGFPSRDAGDFHWVSTFPPRSSLEPSVVVVTIENGLWAFTSEDAFLTYGVLDADDTAELKLPPYSGEFSCVGFETRSQVEGDADNVVFITEVSELPLHLQDAYAGYYAAYAEIDGHELAWQEVQGVARPPLALTYGESHFLPVVRLLRLLGAGPGEVLVDLGSGTGRVVLAAALGLPELGLCRGIEVQRGLHAAAELTRGSLAAAGVGGAPVALQCADFLAEDWADATLVFAMSLCFPEEMLAQLEAQALRLRPGARVVAMHAYFGEASGGAIRPAMVSSAEPRHAVPTEMSFGETPLYVFRREQPGVELDAMD